MITAWLAAIGITTGVVLFLVGVAMLAKALFFKQVEDEGY